MTGTRVRLPVVSALLFSVLAAERNALSYDAWFQAKLYRLCIEVQYPTHNL